MLCEPVEVEGVEESSRLLRPVDVVARVIFNDVSDLGYVLDEASLLIGFAVVVLGNVRNDELIILGVLAHIIALSLFS